MEPTIQVLLTLILNTWCEIQWAVYLPPDAPLDKNISTWRLPDIIPPTTKHYLETIDFFDKPPSDLLKEVIYDWVKILCAKLNIATSTPSFKSEWCINKSKSFSQQNKDGLWKLFHNLRREAMDKQVSTREQTTLGKSGKIYIKTLMNLYLHTIVSHCASFYEIKDFRSTNTERCEAHLACFKNVASDFTGRNLQTPQPIREFFRRHCSKAKSIVSGYEKPKDPPKDVKIGKHSCF